MNKVTHNGDVAWCECPCHYSGGKDVNKCKQGCWNKVKKIEEIKIDEKVYKRLDDAVNTRGMVFVINKLNELIKTVNLLSNKT